MGNTAVQDHVRLESVPRLKNLSRLTVGPMIHLISVFGPSNYFCPCLLLDLTYPSSSRYGRPLRFTRVRNQKSFTCRTLPERAHCAQVTEFSSRTSFAVYYPRGIPEPTFAPQCSSFASRPVPSGRFRCLTDQNNVPLCLFLTNRRFQIPPTASEISASFLLLTSTIPSFAFCRPRLVRVSHFRFVYLA